MKDKKIECTKCCWFGLESELVKVNSDRYPGVLCYDNVCPQCNNDEFYVLERSEKKEG